jgi:ribosomal protein S18 acetylase RimI-like enzyme
MWGASGQRPFSAQSIEKLMDGAGNALVAEAESGEVVACAFWSHNGDMAFLWRLVVKETYRGQGIARMLVHAVEEEIQQAGFEALGLMVRVPNEPAKCLYRSEGYEHMSNTEYWRKGL